MTVDRPTGVAVRCTFCKSEWGGSQLNAPRAGRACPLCRVGKIVERRLEACVRCGVLRPVLEDPDEPIPDEVA